MTRWGCGPKIRSPLSAAPSDDTAVTSSASAPPPPLTPLAVAPGGSKHLRRHWSARETSKMQLMEQRVVNARFIG
ncbi:hypothetical protein L1987_09336 [Smallanthus sonchifolius]|uniref:Uncharacterized protein n=1 Tax=Smallanthus sonchifolius TaxID=185202 RepID=A0ACB9JNL6_9ASTR|nr:hypothetical protein L1987_09336 [Smallanthus sonchifolius]